MGNCVRAQRSAKSSAVEKPNRQYPAMFFTILLRVNFLPSFKTIYHIIQKGKVQEKGYKSIYSYIRMFFYLKMNI